VVPTDGALRVDGAPRHLLVDEHAGPLTHRGYHLLDVLIQDANRLASRETIARDVWDGACGPDANLIVVLYTCRLRHKLRDAEYAGQIRTMWGVGYMLESTDAQSGE
jgi:DNA-binding response OmpR family regulator